MAADQLRPRPVVADTVVVRRAELRDVHDIRELDSMVYRRPWSEKLTVQQVTGRGRVHLVAEESHVVIGHGGIVILDGDAHITTIAVDPTHQRRGVADLLMRHLFAESVANGCGAVTLEVRASNQAAISLYERHGMVAAGTRPGYYASDGEDAIIMWNDSLGMDTDA